MDLKAYAIQTAIIVLGLCIFYIVKSYLPKYFEAKGTNQATKEDIGSITTIVENIKTELLQKTEEIKAELSLVNQHKIQIKNAEREAFFDYNRKLSARIYYLVNYWIATNKFSDYLTLIDNFNELDRIQLELDIADAHLLIFYRDVEFVTSKVNLHNATIEYEKIIRDFVSEVQKLYLNAFFEIERNKENELEISTESWDKIGKINDKYRELRKVQYAVVHSLHYDMMELIYSRLAKIEDEIRRV